MDGWMMRFVDGDVKYYGHEDDDGDEDEEDEEDDDEEDVESL